MRAHSDHGALLQVLVMSGFLDGHCRRRPWTLSECALQDTGCTYKFNIPPAVLWQLFALFSTIIMSISPESRLSTSIQHTLQLMEPDQYCEQIAEWLYAYHRCLL